jgi:UDP:flavonoid glycosyltransferase YjiC (YdhE family)
VARFLFATIAIPAHTSNPLPIAARLVERGHDVRWYAGRAFHERIAATGARPLPYGRATDFSEGELWEHFPQLKDRSGVAVISRAFADVFIGQAAARVDDLRAILTDEPADAMLSDALMYGVGMTHELGGPPWATFGDGPLPFEEPGVPPFGPGLAPLGGPLGRLRDGVVRASARRVIFRRPQQVYDRTRADLGLPPDPRPAVEASASPYLHLQGCTPGFEYPRRALPGHAHWVGAFRPDPPLGWTPPPWWDEVVGGDRPVVHVSQGSIRPDVTELVVPSLHGLADRDALVVVTTGGPSADEVGRAYAEAHGGSLPANARVAPFIPYDTLLARAAAFVTNGGYSGVTMALHHGVPLVQAGTTEEKSEIAARIAWSGVGVKLGTTRPTPEAVGAAVRTVLAEGSPHRAAAERVAAEMRTHDAARESADLLERLATTGRPVLRADTPAPARAAAPAPVT